MPDGDQNRRHLLVDRRFLPQGALQTFPFETGSHKFCGSQEAITSWSIARVFEQTILLGWIRELEHETCRQPAVAPCIYNRNGIGDVHYKSNPLHPNRTRQRCGIGQTEHPGSGYSVRDRFDFFFLVMESPAGRRPRTADGQLTTMNRLPLMGISAHES